MSEPPEIAQGTPAPREQTPAERYRAIIGGIADAVERQREEDRTEADRLARQLTQLDARMLKVGERAALSRFAVRLHWESALEALTAEPWMALRPFPRPDPRADPGKLERADREMHEAYEVLMGLVHRSKWGFRR